MDMKTNSIELTAVEIKPLPPTDESDLWRCGYCHHQIFRCTHQRFCEECGRKIGWEKTQNIVKDDRPYASGAIPSAHGE